jgi:hypothetical protein
LYSLLHQVCINSRAGLSGVKIAPNLGRIFSYYDQGTGQSCFTLLWLRNCPLAK